MICRIFDPKECEAFLPQILHDPRYSDPHLQTQAHLEQRLFAALDRPDQLLFGVWEGKCLTGLFNFIVLPQDHYLELYIALSRSASADREILYFLRACWPGYQADFVFNPRNDLLKDCLAACGASFDTEQHKMVLADPKPEANSDGIELLSKRRFPEYAAMHGKDVYWTAEKIVTAPDRFRVLLAVEHGHVVGYLDVTIKYAENEIYDLFVQEDSRRRGWGKKLLAKAIELNRPNAMMLLVDADNDAAKRLYLSAGFVLDPGGNNQTATWMIPS